MATAVGNIHINLLVDSTRMRTFGTAADIVVRDSARMRTALAGAGRSVDQLRSQMGRSYKMRLFSEVLRQASSANSEVARLRATMLALTALTGTSVTGSFAAAFLLQTADASNRLNNNLRTITTSQEDLLAVRKRLYEVSQDSRSDLQATATLYARVTRAAETFGLSQEKLIKVAQTVQKAFAVGGASQQEASGAAIQLSQGIASDRFSGDEYRSVSENAPVLLQAMAKSIGVTIGGLRKLAFEGKLTGKVVTEAILASADAIDESFSKTIPTVSQSLTKLNNAFLQNIGETDSAYGVTRKLSDGLANLAKNFDDIAKYAGIAALAVGSLLAGRVASGGIGKIGGLVLGTAGIKAKEEIARLSGTARQLEGEMADLRARAGVSTSASGKMSFIATPANLAIMGQYNEKANVLTEVSGRAAVAQAKLAGAMRLGAVATRAGASALALFGGPVGVAFFAAVGAISFMGAEAAKSAERTNRLKKEMIDLGYVSKEFADQIDGADRSLKNLTIDELRSKIGELKDEIFRQQNGRPWWEEMFGGGADNLTENIDRVKGAVNALSSSPAFDFLGGTKSLHAGAIARGFSDNDLPFLKSLDDLAQKAKDGKLTAKEFEEQWDKLSPTFAGVSEAAADMATSIRASVASAEGATKFLSDQEDRLAGLQRSGDTPAWLTTHVTDMQRMATDAKAVQDWLSALQSVSGEMEKQAAFTPEQERLESATDKVAKAWQDYNKQLGITEVVSRDLAKQRAAEILRITDETEAFAKITALRDSLNAKGLTLVDRDAVNTVNDLFDQFSTGQVPVEKMQARLEEISKLRLSDTVDGLVAKIIDAIPELAKLLRVAESFPGAGSAYGRGALGRARRSTAERESVSSDVLASISEENIRQAGLSDAEARIAKEMESIRKDAEAEAKAMGITLKATNERLRADAILKIYAEDRAEAEKKIADLRSGLSDGSLAAGDLDIASSISDLLDSVASGEMPVEAMETRLKEISKLRLSDAMKGLVGDIIAAIPELNKLLHIAQSFPGADGIGAGPSLDTLKKYMSDLATQEGITSGVITDAVKDAGLSERDAAIKSTAKDLIDRAEAAGGSTLSQKDAEAAAARIYDIAQAQKAAKKAADDAADAAKRYADGMADLAAQLALAPLGSFVSQVYDAAEGMGLSKDELQGFIDAVSSGGIDAAPEKFKKIADAMRDINSINIMRGLEFDQAQIFRTDTDKNIYATLRDSGIEVGSVQGEMIARQIKFNAALQDARDIVLGIAEDFRTALGEGKSWWEALATAGLSALDKISAKLVEMGALGFLDGLNTGGSQSGGILGTIFNAIIGGITGGLTGGIAGGAGAAALGRSVAPSTFDFGSFLNSAKGNVFSGPGIGAYSSSIVTGPTIFPFQKGVGLMGEAGWEAVMPLARAPGGKLGVIAANGNSANQNARGLTVINHITGSRQDAAEIARMVTSQVRSEVPGAIREYQKNPYKVHGPTARPA